MAVERIVTAPRLGTQKRGGRPELIRQTRNQRLENKKAAFADQKETPQSQHSKARNMLKKGALLRSLDSGEGQTIAKIQAITAGVFILWGTLPFFVPQFLFWIIGLAGLIVESNFFVGWILPGQETFYVSYIMILVIGTGSMFYAAVMFNLRGVDCFGGHRMLYFLLCLTGYFVVFLNLVPWVALWVLTVIAQAKSSKSEEG